MTVRADKSNAPLRRNEKEKIKKVRLLEEKYREQGFPDEEAQEKAQQELRDER